MLNIFLGKKYQKYFYDVLYNAILKKATSVDDRCNAEITAIQSLKISDRKSEI